MRAYATAGGMTVINRLGNALSGSADDQWSLSPGGEGFPAKGTPMLSVAFYVNGGTSVRISVSYSASE
jgi:hypothetical protein